MAQRDDAVFQLSLTEIAFTVAFILLLLLGYLVFLEQGRRAAAEKTVAQMQSTQEATAAMHEAKQELSGALQAGGFTNAEQVISRLVDAQHARQERDDLKKQVEDLNAQLTALTELQNALKAASPNRPDVTKERVASALALEAAVRKAFEDAPQDVGQRPALASSHATQESGGAKAVSNEELARQVRRAAAVATEFRNQVRVQLGRDVSPGHEKESVQEVVAAAKTYGELPKGAQTVGAMHKENLDLRGQVAFMKKRLEDRGGRDFPPCWADETGAVEYLFDIELRPDSIVIARGWPERRDADARNLPGVQEAVAKPHTEADFPRVMQGIFETSKHHDPECRYYVRLRSTIADAVASDRARLMVENYFYKLEVRR
jgi:hypothetical protein